MQSQEKQATAKQASKKKNASQQTRGAPTKRRDNATKDTSVPARKIQKSLTQPSKLAAGIMRTLHNEHKYITILQDSLERQVEYLAPGGKPDYQIICDMLDYIANYPDEFHHPLEDQIYERLVVRHRASEGDVEELLSQHRSMAQETRLLSKKLSAICAGKQKPRRNQLRKSLQEYVEFHRTHINLEEAMIFPAAKKYLQESDWQAINHSLHVVEDPIFSETNTNKYKRLSDYINYKSEEAVAEFAMAEQFGLDAIIESAQVSADGVAEIGELCKSHVRNSVKQNIETLKASRKDDGVSLVRLPGRLLSDGMKASRDTLREIAKVLSATRTGAAEPFSVRISHFKAMRRDEKKGEREEA